MNRIFHLSLTALFVLVTACNQQNPIEAAPLGEKYALENLAESYRKLSDRYPVAPMSLPPKAKYDFVEQVFANAGYNYSNTLLELSRINPQEVTQWHKDIKQLLLLPKAGLSDEDSKTMYSESERRAIKAIENKIP